MVFRKETMARKTMENRSSKQNGKSDHASATPIMHQRGRATQKYGTVVPMAVAMSASDRLKLCEKLNQLLADTITIRDLYKKHHWQVSGHTFYQLHLLFDKHAEEQSELVDEIAERIALMGGVSVAMAHDVAALTRIERPPRDREEVPVQISRLLEAHEIIIKQGREIAEMAEDMSDAGTNDLMGSDVLRKNEFQAWFVSEHLVETPLVRAE
jgi:starvation-inducible DNA-binding protein